MNPIPSSYAGIEFSQAQKDLLQQDMNAISGLINQIAEYDRQISVHNGNYNYAVSQLSNCGTLSGYVNNLNPAQVIACKASGSTTGNCLTKEKQCTNQYENDRNVAEANRNSVQYAKDLILNNDLPLAKKRYNDDLDYIQNTIKIQIQKNIDATAYETQVAQNQVAINQNNPALLLQQQVDKAAADALKTKTRNETIIKVATFVIIAGVIIWLGWTLIKRIA